MNKFIILVFLGFQLLVVTACDRSEDGHIEPLKKDELNKLKLTKAEELDDFLLLRGALHKYRTLKCGSEYPSEEQKCSCIGEECYNPKYKKEYVEVLCQLSEKYPTWKNSSIQYVDPNPDQQTLSKYWVINFNRHYVRNKDTCDQI